MFAAYHQRENSQTRQIFPASALLVANGTFLLAFATRRYLRIVKAIRADTFPIETRGTLIAVFGTAASTLASLSIVLNAELQSKKRKEESSDN